MACPLLTLQIAPLVVVKEAIVLHSIASPPALVRRKILLMILLSWDEIFFEAVRRGATVRKLDHLPTWLDKIFTWPIVAAPRIFPTLLKSLRKLLVSSTRTLTGYTR